MVIHRDSPITRNEQPLGARGPATSPPPIPATPSPSTSWSAWAPGPASSAASWGPASISAPIRLVAHGRVDAPRSTPTSSPSNSTTVPGRT